MINIDERLKAIAKLVPKCETIADIGTDHGFLPCYIIKNEIAKKAFACDVAIEPLLSAQKNIKKFHLENKIETILTSGTCNLPENIDCIIMAGMGGYLISNLLKESPINYPLYLLQPNSNSDVVRKTLMELNYQIIDEEIVFVKGKYYEIIKACKGKEMLTSEQIKFGPINILKKTDVFLNYHQRRIDIINEILTKINKDSKDFIVLTKEKEELIKILLKKAS